MPSTTLVIIAAIYRKGKFLLTFRDEKNPDHQFNHRWQLPGGGLEFGESPEQTILRELKEEVGVDAHILHLVPKIYSEVRTNWHGIFICFVCSIKDDADIVLNDEASKWGWYSIEEMKSLAIIPKTISMAEDALKSLQ